MENEKSKVPIGAILWTPLLVFVIYKIVDEVPVEEISLLCVAFVALCAIVRSIFRFIGKEPHGEDTAITWIMFLPTITVFVSLLVSRFS